MIDNARINVSKVTSNIILEAGLLVLTIPPYSPQLNPAELAISFIKRRIKKRIAQRLVPSFEDVFNAAGSISELTSEGCFLKLLQNSI